MTVKIPHQNHAGSVSAVLLISPLPAPLFRLNDKTLRPGRDAARQASCLALGSPCGPRSWAFLGVRGFWKELQKDPGCAWRERARAEAGKRGHGL